jgi:hypothetical protein
MMRSRAPPAAAPPIIAVVFECELEAIADTVGIAADKDVLNADDLDEDEPDGVELALLDVML